MRHYDDPVEVRRADEGADRFPEQFLWRGRLWKVRAVLAHWIESGARWPGGERELWRVRAGRGGLESDNVVDLCLDAHGSWQLVGCQD